MSVSVLQKPISLAFGPEFPDTGSWNWVGDDLAEELGSGDRFETSSFRESIPDCDVLLFVKYLPEESRLRELAQHSAILYFPIDVYGSGAELDADWKLLRLCDRVLLHTPFLEKYVRGYARTELVDHHLKFAAPLRAEFVDAGPLLWTGVWLNLPPLVEWINTHGVPDGNELIVLTNFEGHERRSPAEFGFDSQLPVRIEAWTPERHVERMRTARGVIDVKGNDFRQRYKPATKAFDAIASGVPFSVNSGSSVARYLQGLGFEVASPADPDLWFSRDYWNESQRFGSLLREQLSRANVADRVARIIEVVLAERGTP
jgi:hypothetical protein